MSPGGPTPDRPLTESLMSTRLKFLTSTVGTKILIAVTGLALFLFLCGHLAGNLLLFAGPEAFNGYSHKLISNPFIYVVEAGLVAIFLLHVFNAVTNWWSNRGARTTGYQVKEWAGHTSRKSVASTTMIVTGVATFVFVVLHLKTFKYGPWYETPEGIRDLYTLTIEIFRSPLYVAGYVVCMGLIFLHLRHGLSSTMQTLGVNHPRYNRYILMAGTLLAVVIGLGFAIIPVAIFFGGGRS